MQEDMLKTSWKQRLGIAIIAIILLGSSLAVYIGILLGGNSSTKSTEDGLDQELITKLENEYYEKSDELNNEAVKYSDKYFDDFVSYKSRVKAYNSMTINNNGLSTEDLKKGSGEKITEDSEYFMYYIGWCADETILDDSFDNQENPTALSKFVRSKKLDGENELIQGIIDGAIGMRLGGIREISIPGELAYGDEEKCGGTNQALKFIVLPFEKTGKMSELSDELELLSEKIQFAYYGLDYDAIVSGSSE